ncbi:MAG: hypothetical protein ACRDK5_03680 [Solirubrobacterales bacterium]
MRTHTITTPRPAVLLSLLALWALGLLVGGGAGQSTAAIPAATDSQAVTTLETTITKAPRRPIFHARAATFEFTANQAGATFECALRLSRGSPDHPRPDLVKPFAPCTSPLRVMNKRPNGPGKNKLQVRATVGGVTDATPARATWRTLLSG